MKSKEEFKSVLYTIGYQGITIDTFFTLCRKYNIQQVIDVRSNPFSRKFGFSKKVLANLCKQQNISYYHIPELGIPADKRKNLNSSEDYQKLFEYYEKEILSHQISTIKKVLNLILEKPSVLLCMESNPSLCHRTRLAKKLSRYLNLDIYHINQNEV